MPFSCKAPESRSGWAQVCRPLRQEWDPAADHPLPALVRSQAAQIEGAVYFTSYTSFWVFRNKNPSPVMIKTDLGPKDFGLRSFLLGNLTVFWGFCSFFFGQCLFLVSPSFSMRLRSYLLHGLSVLTYQGSNAGVQRPWLETLGHWPYCFFIPVG